MKNTFFLFLSILFGCQQMAEQNTYSPEAFDEMLESYYQESLKLYPLNATFAGDDRYNDLFQNDLTEAFRQQEKNFYTTYLTKLSDFETSTLSSEQQISYEVLKWECDIHLQQLQYPKYLLPVDQFWTPQLIVGQLAGGSSAQPFRNKKDYDNWLSRLEVFTAWCDTAIANMRKGIALNVVLPKALTAKVIPQLNEWAAGPAENHHFYSPVKNIPDSVSSEDATAIQADYKEMITGQLVPAFSRLQQFLKEEYLPACRETSGYSALPNGEDWYQHQIKKYTTTNLTADSVFNLGLVEVARLKSEMEKVKSQVGFEGDLKAFFDYVRTKPELVPFDKPEQVIEFFNQVHEKMKPNLEKLFDKTPKTPFEVRRTEAFREASASAEYISGSLDGTRPGIFYVPIPDVKTYNNFSDEDLFLHEAIPGHHYQISLTQENESLPSFRRTLWYSAYGEGWALYSESLGKELGLYEDPYQYFGMLSAEMHRAIRLVVDAGIHAKGWTREQAIRYSLDNEAESESGITSEVERYMAEPGQALSYKIGQLKIWELRDRASTALGDRFDIKEFHNQILETGCVPLQVLEKKIDSWIAARAKPF